MCRILRAVHLLSSESFAFGNSFSSAFEMFSVGSYRCADVNEEFDQNEAVTFVDVASDS